MMTCEQVRDELALRPDAEEEPLREHLAGCTACAAYRRRSATLDTVLRGELRWEVPAVLTAQLLAIATGQPLAAPAPVRPKSWYVTLVYALTFSAVAVSLMVAWQFVGLVAGQLGVQEAVAQLMAAPARGLAQLAQAMPESRPVIDFVIRVRDQLMWLLLVAVLWAALDRYGPRGASSAAQRA